MVVLFCVIFAVREYFLRINHNYLGYETICHLSIDDAVVSGMDDASMGLWYAQAGISFGVDSHGVVS